MKLEGAGMTTSKAPFLLGVGCSSIGAVSTPAKLRGLGDEKREDIQKPDVQKLLRGHELWKERLLTDAKATGSKIFLK